MRLRVDPARLAELTPAERELVEGDLRELQGELERNPLLGFEPHPKQVEFMSSRMPLKAFLGGNRSGKTTASVVDTLVQCLDRELVPPHLVGFKKWDPPFFGRFVTPDLTNTLEGVVLQKIRDWCPAEAYAKGGFDKSWDKQLRMLRFKNGSWLQFFSNDQDLDKFGGAALHRVCYDEEPQAAIRRECLMRLIDYGGDEVFSLTPLQGLSWLFEEVWEPWEQGKLDDATVVVVDMDDNPHLDELTKKRVLAGLSEEERQARKSGRFVHFAGLIFPEFDEHHIVPQSRVPEGAKVVVGIDPGIRHMCAVVFCFIEPDGTLVVFDEIAAKDSTVGEVAQLIQLKCAQHEIQPFWFVIDPASRNRAAQTGRSDQMEFSDHGIPTIPGQNDVRSGINRLKERFQNNRIRVQASCPTLIDELRKYRWASPKRSENDAREMPVKKDDHLVDALRYVAMSRPAAPELDKPDGSATYRDRILRHQLRRFENKVVSHPNGPGVFI